MVNEFPRVTELGVTDRESTVGLVVSGAAPVVKLHWLEYCPWRMGLVVSLKAWTCQ